MFQIVFELRVVVVYRGLNEKEEMFKWLEQSYKEGSLIFRALRYAPCDPTIRKDPRYVSLFSRVNIPA
jgi:hypothetical protein